MTLTQDQVLDTLNFDPESGVFYFKKKAGRRKAGDVAVFCWLEDGR